MNPESDINYTIKGGYIHNPITRSNIYYPLMKTILDEDIIMSFIVYNLYMYIV